MIILNIMIILFLENKNYENKIIIEIKNIHLKLESDLTDFYSH